MNEKRLDSIWQDGGLSGMEPEIPMMCLIKFPGKLFLWLALWAGLQGISRAVEVTEGPKVEVTETAATIQWTTDAECGTQVKFGRSRHNFNRRVEGGVGVAHEVRITDLLPGTTYFYSIGTAKKALKEGTLMTKGAAPPSSAPAVEKEAPKPPPPVMKPVAKPTVKPLPVPAPTAGKLAYSPPPTAETWGDRWSLKDHFDRHGRDFGAVSPDDYAAKAWLFLQRAKDEGLPAKLDESDGTIRVWDGKTRSFAAYNLKFLTRTYFRPESADYFKRQPGKPVRLRHAPAPP